MLQILLVLNFFYTGTNERLRIKSDGNVGIGTDDPGTYRLRIRSSNPTLLRIDTQNNEANEITGIEFGIPGYTSSNTAKITSTTSLGFINNLQFSTASGENLSSVRMTIKGDGNVGIGGTDTLSRLSRAASPSLFVFVFGLV